jgi:AcrR family transcriptional regulator
MSRAAGKRSYESVVRREHAALTRRRILEAADELFGANGYVRTTIARIAEQAGVATDTVYATFGSKGRVLTALLDMHLVHGADVQNELELPEARAIRDEPDQRSQIRLFVRFFIEGVERIAHVYAIMRSAAEVDAEVSSIFLEMQTYRARNVDRIAGWIAKNGRLRVSKKRAGEIIWALASPELISMLREQQRWSREEYAKWLGNYLATFSRSRPNSALGSERRK